MFSLKRLKQSKDRRFKKSVLGCSLRSITVNAGVAEFSAQKVRRPLRVFPLLLAISLQIGSVAYAQTAPKEGGKPTRCNFFAPIKHRFPVLEWCAATRKAITDSCTKNQSLLSQEQATAQYLLTVEPSGKVKTLQLKTSSGDANLDHFYRDRIFEAGPFCPAQMSVTPQAAAEMHIRSKLITGPFLISISKSMVEVKYAPNP